LPFANLRSAILGFIVAEESPHRQAVLTGLAAMPGSHEALHQK
jgi:hypothetical protein